VIDIETALLQQLLNVAQRKRIAKILPDRTKYEAGFGLPPFEDRGSGYHFAILSRHQPESCNTSCEPLTNLREERFLRFWGSLGSVQFEMACPCAAPKIGAAWRHGTQETV
jgi:hypothetical protein